MIGVFATAGMLLSQASYRGAGLAAPLATLTVVNPVVAAAVGITMFGETFRYGTTGTALALGCGVVAAGGLILLTTERISGTRRTRRCPCRTAVPVPAAGRAMPDAAVRTEPVAGRRAEPYQGARRRSADSPYRSRSRRSGWWSRRGTDGEPRGGHVRPRRDVRLRLGAAGRARAAARVQRSPPPGDTPDDIEGIDEPPWPHGGYYGLPFLPLLPAPAATAPASNPDAARPQSRRPGRRRNRSRAPSAPRSADAGPCCCPWNRSGRCAGRPPRSARPSRRSPTDGRTGVYRPSACRITTW